LPGVEADYLAPGAFADSDHPDVVAYARDACAGVEGDRSRACRLFLAVRDDIRYHPYLDFDRPETYRASSLLEAGEGFCVAKAALLCACARAVGIPARLAYADVRNHIAPQKLADLMQTDLFYWHGFTEFLLDDRWVAATPAFNAAMCARFGVRPVEFDGVHDALLHPYDAEGRHHMEYVHRRGSFPDVPFERIRASYREAYPLLFAR
jgi:transglutaminase-like putative cysteine protease